MQLQHPHGCSFYSEIGGFWFCKTSSTTTRRETFCTQFTPCGTDGYIAPDFLINKEMGQKSDILSFGVVRNLLPCYLYKELKAYDIKSENVRLWYDGCIIIVNATCFNFSIHF